MDVDDRGMQPLLSPMLLDELADFATRHRPCGQLTGDATEPAPDGYLLSVACSGGVTFLRWVTPEEAIRDLVGRDCGLRSA